MPAQNDRMPLSATEFVILNAVKDLAFFILRFFAKEAQNDRMRAQNNSRRWHSMPNLSSNLPDPLLGGGIKGGGYLKFSNADVGTYKSVYKGKITA
jgi:hypothetical protein